MFRNHRLPHWLDDVVLSALILWSVVTYFMEVEIFHSAHSLAGHPFFLWSERIVAGCFTVEYLVRWIIAENRRRYPLQPMAIIDLIAILPFWIGFFVAAPYLHIVRALRILRLVKFIRHSQALQDIGRCLWESRYQLLVVAQVVGLVMGLGSAIMYELENKANPKAFGSITDALWWTFVTLSTVGYGDAYPITAGGRVLACILMVFGVGMMGALVGIVGGACARAFAREEKANSTKLHPADDRGTARTSASGTRSGYTGKTTRLRRTVRESHTRTA